MQTAPVDRRTFLKGAGILGLTSALAYMGGQALSAANGSYPVEVSPYAPSATLARWPTSARDASPILVLLNDPAANPYGAYYGEILRAEGLNALQIGRLSTIDDAPLAWYDTIILCEGNVPERARAALEQSVVQGGNLIVMRPDASLAALCGVEIVDEAIHEGYVRVDAAHPIGVGITTEIMQYHGPANCYRLIAGEEVCTIAGDRAFSVQYPGVAVRQVGKGWVGMWAFDLAKSIVLTRQGNPALADTPSADWDGIRPINLFVGWLDLECAKLPQADEQQRLLANMLSAFGQNRRPLPRLWYFPQHAQAMLIATADCHGNSAEAIEELLTTVEQRDGHASIYYTPHPGSDLRRFAKRAALSATQWPLVGSLLDRSLAAPAPADVANWRDRGHEFGLHPYVDEYSVEPGLVPSWRRYWKEFTGLGYAPVPPTTRTHRIQWSGWTETARVQASFGMGMNLDYYHWGPLFQDAGGNWINGHLNGSGLPLRFVDDKGQILTIYQQLTHLADDHLLAGDWGGYVMLNGESAVAVSREYLSASRQGRYAAITANFHVDPLDAGNGWTDQFRTWLRGTLDVAADAGVPIWSALEWLGFTTARHDARVDLLDWDGGRLLFEVALSGENDTSMTVMVPLAHGDTKLVGIEVDGRSAGYQRQTIGAVEYACVLVTHPSARIAATFT